jgi:hypothetical protein
MHDMIRESRDCVIRDCYNTGNISAYNNAGGICGHNRESGVINCHNTGNISASYDKTFDSYAGGICGDGGDISNCYNTGDISAVHNAGGICGDNGGISDCYNTGNISAKGSNAGGICGRGGDIRNCYNTGDISSAENAGGICGKGGRISNCFAANATVTSYEGRRISSGSGYINITNCHALISMKINGLVRRSIKSDSRDGVDAELAEFKDRSWITSVLKWDFADTWTMPADGGLPKLSQRTP